MQLLHQLLHVPGKLLSLSGMQPQQPGLVRFLFRGALLEEAPHHGGLPRARLSQGEYVEAVPLDPDAELQGLDRTGLAEGIGEILELFGGFERELLRIAAVVQLLRLEALHAPCHVPFLAFRCRSGFPDAESPRRRGPINLPS